MNYHDITKADMLNGAGLRVVLWVAGCEHHCKNCQNPITHNPNGGLPFDLSAFCELDDALDTSYIAGLTLSGGDPLYKANRDEITELCIILKQRHPNKTIWCYTGYLWEDVKHLDIMKYIDVLCDGRFVEELKDVNAHWVGSTNQRVIDVQKSLNNGEVVLWKEKE